MMMIILSLRILNCCCCQLNSAQFRHWILCVQLSETWSICGDEDSTYERSED